ncbi:MAG: PadR family transcriptional regulator [Gemmatimonadota bacterium]
MSRNQFLGEFEHLVLLAVARCGDEAYGMVIRQELEARSGATVSIGSVYSALDRMERNGYVASTVGEPTPTRGGRAKRYYRLRAAGVGALTRARSRLDRFWDGLELEPGAQP